MRIACLLLDFTMSVVAFFATMLCFNCDSICAFLAALSTTIATVGALLIAYTPRTPLAFAINWAWVFVAWPVLPVPLHMFAFATTMLCMDGNIVLSRLAAGATVRTAITPFLPMSFAIDWAINVTTHFRSGVAVLVRALLSPKLGWLCDGVCLLLSAMTTEILTITSSRNVSIACRVLTPSTFAINWAIRLVAHRFWQLVTWRGILALYTTV